jgi:tetratricopeptide (TPR) repeat protein
MNEERRQTYLNFLLQAILAFLDSTGNPRVVYSLLETNPDKLDDGIVELFQSWIGVYSFLQANFYKLRVHLPNVSPDKAETLMAAIIAALCDMLVQFDREGKASNIEIAIAGHKMILNVFDRKTFSKEWATTQVSLGAAYRNRIKGDQAENLELSLDYYRNALEVFTPDASPIRWADIQSNLANTYRDIANIYRDHLQKNPAVNLERSIACCCNALSVYFRFSRWEAWAGTQNNLALVYKERIWGNPAENLEKAIECCFNALKFYTCGAFSLTERHRWQWAKIQSNLSIMFRNRS